MIPPEIRTIKEQTEARIKEKGSVFIAYTFPLKNPEEAEAFLTKIRKQDYDATHHCYAYKLSDLSFKYSDDGEPSGSAGLRILNAIDHFNLTNLLIVVTRYFGGTKLGVGPLGKAYYTAAENALSKCEIIQLKSYIRIDIIADFEYINHIHRLLSDTDSKILNIYYSENVKFECLAVPDIIDSLKEQVTGITRGKGQLNVFNDYYLI